MPPELASLGTAAAHYFYRPALAFFRAFMLEEYARAGIDFRRPVLDLGCGDGTFGAVLVARGVMAPADAGLDGSRDEVREASRGVRLGGICGDLTALPLRSGAIGTVLSNAVLSSLMSPGPRAIDRSLAEVARVLRPGGCFAFAVALPGFNTNLRGTRLLRRIGAESAARRYVERVNRRHSHTELHDETVWREKLTRAGFTLQQARYFITARVARRYSTLHLARGFPMLQRLPVPWLKQRIAGAEAAAFPRLFGRLFAAEQAVPQEERRKDAGFVLLVARKLPAAP